MKDEIQSSSYSSFIPHPSSFFRRRSQVVRQRSAKPLFIGSIPIAASNKRALRNKKTLATLKRRDITGVDIRRFLQGRGLYGFLERERLLRTAARRSYLHSMLVSVTVEVTSPFALIVT
jgi:hypothetical protein